MNDGGPAFPVLDYIKPGVVASPPGKRGMSRLDWFAGQALASELNTAMRNKRFEILVAIADSANEPVAAVIARECYEMAAAMLSESDRRAEADH